jgi:GMP synthase-like glutamine amidotransferase
MRVGLLKCDRVLDQFETIAGDYNEMVSAMLDENSAELVVFNVYADEFPDRPEACDAYIISGSSASVFEDKQWIRNLEVFVREVAEASIPMFGICFGLQVMATAFGGAVERSDRGWGVGVHSIQVAQTRPWMQPHRDVISLIMLHQDQVVALPDNAAVLGSSQHCPNFLVEFAPGLVGVQGHPEFPPAYAAALYKDRRDRLGSLTDPAIKSLTAPTSESVIANWMQAIFQSLVD